VVLSVFNSRDRPFWPSLKTTSFAIAGSCARSIPTDKSQVKPFRWNGHARGKGIAVLIVHDLSFEVCGLRPHGVWITAREYPQTSSSWWSLASLTYGLVAKKMMSNTAYRFGAGVPALFRIPMGDHKALD
jgi:hypothetical protein